MIAIKEQMIQTSQLDLKGCHRCALSFLIPAHAYTSDTPVTITPLFSLSVSAHSICIHFCECISSMLSFDFSGY